MTTQPTIIESLKGKLIVSCQAEDDSPFNAPHFITAFAQAAERGGAAGVRIRNFENIEPVRKAISLPIIGLTKGTYADGSVLITPRVEDAVTLQTLGADIIAVDGTTRPRPGYTNGGEIIKTMKAEGIRIVMADIATMDDALMAQDAGADLVGTTLSGYTPDTAQKQNDPDYELIENLAKKLPIPVIAEGRIRSPEEAKRALDCGAYAVVVGSAITRPVEIVRRFVDWMERSFSG